MSNTRNSLFLFFCCCCRLLLWQITMICHSDLNEKLFCSCDDQINKFAIICFACLKKKNLTLWWRKKSFYVPLKTITYCMWIYYHDFLMVKNDCPAESRHKIFFYKCTLWKNACKTLKLSVYLPRMFYPSQWYTWTLPCHWIFHFDHTK